MAEIEEKINTENKRDYDKEPIVIEDYNMIFGLFSEMVGVFKILCQHLVIPKILS